MTETFFFWQNVRHKNTLLSTKSNSQLQVHHSLPNRCNCKQSKQCNQPKKTYWTCLFNQTKMQFIMRFHCIEFICNRNRQLVKHFLFTHTNIVFTINQNMSTVTYDYWFGLMNFKSFTSDFQLNFNKKLRSSFSNTVMAICFLSFSFVAERKWTLKMNLVDSGAGSVFFSRYFSKLINWSVIVEGS